MFSNIRRDLAQARTINQGGEPGVLPIVRELFNPGTTAILIYRFGFWADHRSFAPARLLLRMLHFLLQYLFAWRAGIFIPVKARIGPGMVIHTWGGGVFVPCCPIGRDFTIIGGGVLFDYSTRQIGDGVRIGAGTKGVGKIRIGNRVRTGPNSVLHEDVPDDCTVFGNPGRVIRAASAFRHAGEGWHTAAAVSARPASDVPVRAGAVVRADATADAVHEPGAVGIHAGDSPSPPATR